MMKKMKWFLLAVALLAAPAMQAQLRFGVKGGVNIASVKFNQDVIDSENITGFHIGPMIEMVIPVAGLGVDAAVVYSQKGFGLNDKGYRNDYIDVPVNLKYKIMLPLVKPYVAAGPYASFRVSGDKLRKIPGSISEQLKTKSFGAGLNFTAGAEVFDIVQVGLTYSLGLTDNYETLDTKNFDVVSTLGKPHTWMISAAVFF